MKLIVRILRTRKFIVWKNVSFSTLQELAQNYQQDIRNLNRNLSLCVNVCGQRKAASNVIISTDIISECFFKAEKKYV